jgi:hypothetical protein
MLSGCTSTVHYAVIAPNQVMADDQGCFRQCQLVHAGETRRLVACMHNCPGVHVVDGKRCEEVNFDASTNQCRTEHAQRFDPTVGAIFIVIGLVALTAIAASGAHSQAQ